MSSCSGCSPSGPADGSRCGCGKYFPSFRFYLHCHMLLVISLILFAVFPPTVLERTSLVAIVLEFPAFIVLWGIILSAPIVPFVSVAILLLAAKRESRSLAAIGMLDLAVSGAQWLALSIGCI